MLVDFHKDMDKYIASKRRRRLFSDLRSKMMNKKAVFSYKATNKFGELKGRLTSKVEEVKKKKEPEREITREDINELVEKKGIKRELREKIELPKEGDGWKEIRIDGLEEKKEGLTGLEEKKKRLQETLAKIQEKERAEKEKIMELSDENEQRLEPEEDKIKRLELEEEIKILKEKQKIEEDRLSELRKARKKEQMEALRGRVLDILFKKKSKVKKDMVEEVRKEIRAEAKLKEAERQKAEVKEKYVEEQKPKEEPKEIEEVTEDKKEPKKSFFSKFIQIKTAEQIAREEGERLREEEEQALKDQLELNKVLEQDMEETRTNMPPEEQVIDFSTLFPEENIEKKQNGGDIIELDQGYKIKVVRNQ